MFDVKKILSRSWQILWNYRVLWAFGFFLALATGGANIGNNSRYTISDERRTPEGIQMENWDGLEGDTVGEKMADAMQQMQAGFEALREEYPVEFGLGVSAAITLVVVFLILGIVAAVLRYVSEAAAIRMVDEYEQSGAKVGFRQGWKYGWTRRSWRLFFVNFLVHLPVLALLVMLGLVAWRIIASIFGGVEATIITSVIAGSGLAFLSIFVTVLVMVVLYVVRDFAWRLIVLEEKKTGESLRLSWALLKRQWKNIGLMWLVMAGLRIAWGIAFFILVFPLMVISIFTAIGGVAVALVPTLLTAGITSLLAVPDYWPWIFAGIIGLPFFFVVAFSPILLVGGWAEIYNSSVWTLTYRELKALESVAPVGGPEEAAPA